MKYVGFEVHNFRGIKELHLDFSKNQNFKVFTLVGLNESGKTTILEAINLLQEHWPEAKRHLLIPRSKNRNFNDKISVAGSLELDETDEAEIKKYAKSLDFTIVKDIKTIKIQREYLFKGSIFEKSTDAWTISLVGKRKKSQKEKLLTATDIEWQKIIAFIKNKLKPPIIYYPNFLADFPQRIYLEEQEKESKEQPEYRRVLQDILDSLDEGMTVEEHILARIAPAKKGDEAEKGSLESVLETMSTKITEDVFNAWERILSSEDKKTIEGKQIVVSYDVETAKSPDGVSEILKPYIEIKVKEGPEKYQISERSLGFRWFFSYFLFTEFRKNRTIDKGEIIFLIDEPASNLHSTAQKKLLETFGELIDKSKLMYTTHSHHLIEQDWLEGVYIVQNKAINYDNEISYNSSRTDIEAIPYRQFVAEHPNQQTYFQPILDKLDYQPSKLEMVPDIAIVEGKNDFYTLKYLLVNYLSPDFQKINLYPGGGAGKNEKIIRLYISWSKNFLVIGDGDNAGVDAKRTYEENIGPIVSNRVFSLADVSANFKGKATEDLFSSDAERMRIIQEIFPKQLTYSKVKFNQAIQNLLFLNQKVQLNKQTLENFRKVLEFIEANLLK